MFLRQSTSQVIRFGPCLDITDGVTEETALTLAQADMRLSKDGGAFAQKSAAGNATHDSDGWYSITLSTTDTGTVGELIINIHQPANMLPVWQRYWVLEEVVYDDLFGAAAVGPAVASDIIAAATIAGAVWDEDATGHQTSGTFGKAIGDPLASAETLFDAVVTDAAGTNVAADVIAVKADTAAILADTGTDGVLLAATATSAQLVDDVWDEVLTGATHNIANSSGRRIRGIQESGSAYGGFIWIDTVNGTAGTTSYENGTSDNPVDSIADANTLAAALGIPRFKIAPGSTITLAATQANQYFTGAGWTLALGAQNIAGTFFEGATVSGTGTGAAPNFDNCIIGAVTLAGCTLDHCTFTGTITASAASDYYLIGCSSGVAGGGTPTFDFGAAVANTNLNVRHYSGGLQIDNKDGTGTDLMSLEGNGQLVVAASSSGAISIRGNFKVTNTGGATITYDDNTQGIADTLADTGTDGVVLATDAVSAAAMSTAAVNEISRAIGFQTNTATGNIEFLMVDSTDFATPKTGLTVSGTRSIDGGAFGAATGTIAEVGNGIYQIDASAADMNGTIITFRFTATGAADMFLTVKTVA